MKLEELGFDKRIEVHLQQFNLQELTIGRVAAEHKERYLVYTETTELEAEITGNMRFTAKSRADFPAVGDWVLMQVYENMGIIHQIMPRFSLIARQSVSQYGEMQVIAANIDVALLVQAADRDFNLNRLERYLTICYQAKVEPIIVLTKTDLAKTDRLQEIDALLEGRLAQIRVLKISNQTLSGISEMKELIEKGKTYCLLGSSGVGKSSLMNNLLGKELMKTNSISKSTNKGRHVTSHRELILLPNGGILIDNPGMREVGILDSGEGLETTFDKIIRLAHDCRYDDCTHTRESGCAVIAAVQNGEISEDAYQNYLKMYKEKQFFEQSQAEKRQKDKKFGKMMKNYKKTKDK